MYDEIKQDRGIPGAGFRFMKRTTLSYVRVWLDHPHRLQFTLFTHYLSNYSMLWVHLD